LVTATVPAGQGRTWGNDKPQYADIQFRPGAALHPKTLFVGWPETIDSSLTLTTALLYCYPDTHISDRIK
jgi:hypothetical protein